MSRGGPVGEEEVRRILEALEEGRSVRDVAREFSRATGTISNVAARNGLDLERSATKKAALAKSCYASDDRIKMIGRGLDALATALPNMPPPKDMKEWALAVAILIDKRRGEEATDPTARGGEIAELFQKMTAEEGGS